MGTIIPDPEKDPSSYRYWKATMQLEESQAEEESEQVTIKDFLPISWSIFLYVGDLIGDIVLACYYYNSNQFLYFWLTFSFVLVPMIVTSIFSLVWYIHELEDSNDELNEYIPKASRKVWVIRIFFLIFGIAPLLRYITALFYGVKGYRTHNKWKQKQYYEFMKYEDIDGSFLRVFEAFLEAAPQVTLQLLIIINQITIHENFKAIPISSFEAFRLGFALLSLGCAVAGFNRVARSFGGKKITPFLGGAHLIHIAWHILTICARVFALAVFAACYPIAMICCCLAHSIFIMSWLTYQDFYLPNSGCTCSGTFVNFVSGLAYIFTFYSPEEGRTRKHYTIYYSLIFLENILMLLVCVRKFEIGVGLLILFSDILVFSIGIVCMVIYYKFLHPNIRKPVEI